MGEIFFGTIFYMSNTSKIYDMQCLVYCQNLAHCIPHTKQQGYILKKVQFNCEIWVGKIINRRKQTTKNNSNKTENA